MARRKFTKALCLLLISVVACVLHYGINHCFTTTENGDIGRIQRVLLAHHDKMDAALQQIADSLSANAQCDTLRLLNEIGQDGDYSLYLFNRNRLAAWSNALLPIVDLHPSQLNKSILKTDNGWYYVRKHQAGRIGIYALFRIKSSYPVDNDYLKDELNSSFGIDGRCVLTMEKQSTNDAILAPDGTYLFSVSSENSHTLTSWQIAVDAVLLALWLIFVFLAVGTFTIAVREMGISNRALLLLALMLVGIYVWALNIELPNQMSQWFLFSPQVFAYDWWAPSLFFLLLFTLMAFTWSYFMYRLFNFDKISHWSVARSHMGIVSLGLIVLLYVVFFAVNVAINIMVYNSTDLAIYVGDLDISGATIVKLIILSLLALSFMLVLERVYAEITNRLSVMRYVSVILLFVVVFVIPMAALLPWFEMTFYIGFLAVNPIYFQFKRQLVAESIMGERNVGMRFSVFVWFMFMVAFFVCQRLTSLNTSKERENRDLLINNLSFSLVREDDPVAETLLSSMEHNIAADTLLHKLFGRNSSGVNLYSYMRERYFDGYFTRYDMQVIPCIGPESYVQMSATGEEYNCYNYFEELTTTFGQRIAPKSKFYRLNDNDGSPSYFGMFSFYNRQADIWYRIHIEINQKQQMIETGYPELLTNNRDRINTRMLKGYSYAKYFGRTLQTANGQYSYPRFDDWIGDMNGGDNKNIRTSDYSHSVLAATDNQTIVLSYPSMTLRQYMADYSYIFLSMFIISALVLFIVGRNHGLLYSNMSIHERIQATFVLFVMVLLIVICFLSAWESMQNFEHQSLRRMNNTLLTVKNTVIQAIDELLPEPLTPFDADNILHRATQTMAVDAHIYSAEGYLIGTSRRELFDNGITSPLINSQALQMLRVGNDVFMKENIGHLEYFTIYSPITDIDNNTIGIISMPYFSDVNAMRTQLKSTLVPITTAYMVVILLAVLFSYFLAKGISKPLQIVSQKLRLVELQHKNDHLYYPHYDEIGLLVSEYNRMIDELERSAEKLAQSERENTWREMARQIAHEIKNPLTPMKLSVQYMIKAWEKMDADKFDAYIRKTADTLVEQIDHLAFVASEFSNLAKTTQQGELSKVDIIDKLRNAVSLYDKSENATVSISTQVRRAYAMVNAEQIMSVFNNLIKNALQSVAQGQQAKIRTTATVVDDRILITVTDNGRGIAPEVREKIFKPNFTTKSTGMGLGLAIVKTIVNNVHGDIWFETEEEHGTTFFVSLPEVK